MNPQITNINNLYILDTTNFIDNRGTFKRAFDANVIKELGIDFIPCQISYSINPIQNTLRGLHYQHKPFNEMKIINCVSGKIFDVVVDLDPKSKTFKNVFTYELSEADSKCLIIPYGCAHGFLTMEDNTIVHYIINKEYNVDYASGINWKDNDFDILWPRKPKIISEKDNNLPCLNDFLKKL